MACVLEETLAHSACSYLHPSITPETIREAKHAGITGVKMYPANVTTGSSQGVTDYAVFYPVMAEMERWVIFACEAFCPAFSLVSSVCALFLVAFISAYRSFATQWL